VRDFSTLGVGKLNPFENDCPSTGPSGHGREGEGEGNGDPIEVAVIPTNSMT
jgi:hypothetical protein